MSCRLKPRLTGGPLVGSASSLKRRMRSCRPTLCASARPVSMKLSDRLDAGGSDTEFVKRFRIGRECNSGHEGSERCFGADSSWGCSVIKSELVQRMAARNPHLYQRDIENIIDAILGEIADALARGERVELRGFGAFSTKQRQARTGRNPRTGDRVPVTEKLAPFFKTGKEMRDRLNRATVEHA